MEFGSRLARVLDRIGDGCVWGMAAIVIAFFFLLFYGLVYWSN